jgi:hypothetical protein
MYNLSIDYDARRGHHAKAHDLSHIGDFFEFDLHTSLFRCDPDKVSGGLTVSAARTQYFDVFHSSLLIDPGVIEHRE